MGRRPATLGTTALAAAALSVLVACDEVPESLSLTASEIPSPAGADSGQPSVFTSGGTVFMSWLGRSDAGGRQLLFSTFEGGSWSAPRVVAERERFLVSVADFPSMVKGSDGSLWAHWLERDPEGFGYGIRMTRSGDGGASWQEPWIPHDDRTATEHGFVSWIPMDGRVGLAWLDGRGFAEREGAAPPTMETALLFRTFDADGAAGEETQLDVRACDCCQTDVAQTAEGPILVYRDRSPEEIRDIRVLRHRGGAWHDEGLVHDDGWETGACPVNGPAVAARDRRVAVAWFTAAAGEAKVQVAFSNDGGSDFRAPTRLDGGAPAGRVDVVLLEDGSALVSWLERTGGDAAEVRLRRVSSDGRTLEQVGATAALTERAGGFPRLALAGDDAIIVAWTDVSELTPRVRVTRIELEEG